MKHTPILLPSKKVIQLLIASCAILIISRLWTIHFNRNTSCKQLPSNIIFGEKGKRKKSSDFGENLKVNLARIRAIYDTITDKLEELVRSGRIYEEHQQVSSIIIFNGLRSHVSTDLRPTQPLWRGPVSPFISHTRKKFHGNQMDQQNNYINIFFITFIYDR